MPAPPPYTAYTRGVCIVSCAFYRSYARPSSLYGIYKGSVYCILCILPELCPPLLPIRHIQGECVLYLVHFTGVMPAPPPYTAYTRGVCIVSCAFYRSYARPSSLYGIYKGSVYCILCILPELCPPLLPIRHIQGECVLYLVHFTGVMPAPPPYTAYTRGVCIVSCAFYRSYARPSSLYGIYKGSVYCILCILPELYPPLLRIRHIQGECVLYLVHFTGVMPAPPPYTAYTYKGSVYCILCILPELCPPLLPIRHIQGECVLYLVHFTGVMPAPPPYTAYTRGVCIVSCAFYTDNNISQIPLCCTSYCI